MNNSRYLRECDFARMKFFLEKNIWKGLRKLKASIINGGSTVRYRKSLQFLDFFQIRSKVIINASVCSFHYWLLTCIFLKCMYLSTDTLKRLCKNKNVFESNVNERKHFYLLFCRYFTGTPRHFTWSIR